MPTLHTLNSADSALLQRCTSACKEGDSLVLLEAGTNNAIATHANAELLLKMLPQVKIVAVGEAIANALAEVEWISYEDFVELAASHNPLQSWY